MNYKQIIKSFIDISFIGYLLNFKANKSNFELLGKNKFINVTNYWKTQTERIKSSPEINILVDSLMFHPSYNEKNFLTANIIREKRQGSLYALLPFSNSTSIKFFARLFNINKFISVYSLLNIKAIFLSLFQTLNLLPKLKYEITKGIEIYIDGIEIGALVYDEFLRKSDMHTYRKISFVYVLFIYRCLYHYYVYKDVIKKHQITDIVCGHPVYAIWGLLTVAASSLNRDIKIWNWRNLGGNKLDIINYLAQIPIPKPKYYNLEYEALIINHFKEKELSLETEIEKVIKQKFAGALVDRDAINVFKANKILTVDEFNNEYHYDHKKKNIFLFSHAFVDAVRYARWSLFSDHYTWLEQTLKYISANNLDANIFIKPHPSEHLYPCKMTAASLVDTLNHDSKVNFICLTNQVSNNVIFEMADLVITASGTVSAEAPMFGLNVLVAGENDCENAKAIIQPLNIQEYFYRIMNFKNIGVLDSDTIKRAKLAFYWYNKLTYVYLPISIDSLDISLDNNNKTQIISWLELMDKTYKNNINYSIKKSEILSALNFSLKNNFQDLFYLK
jgi:hypothetical protein